MANLQSTKIELAQIILNSQNEKLINKVKALIKSEEQDFWLDLTETQKEELEISRNQIKNGQVEEWQSLKKRIS